MILRDDSPAPVRRKRSRLLVAILPLIALLAVLGTWLLSQPASSGQAIFRCDMEKVVRSSKWSHFVGEGQDFLHGETRSPIEARSGNYSSATYKGKEYGVAWKSEDILPGDHIEASIWRKSSTRNGALVASGNWGLYMAAEIPVESGANGWELVKVSFTVPPVTDTPSVQIYVYSFDSVPVFWDDIEVHRYRRSASRNLPDYRQDSLPTVNLIIGEKGWTKLLNQRREALNLGILTTGEDDWVSVKMTEGRNQVEGRLRLKGDWTDHLIGDKWSFRIVLDPQYAWKRMTTFSLQSAEARHFLDEWLYHRALEQEDVLTTRYDFVHVRLNGRSLGLYVYEEHFAKQIPEYHHRREGPILRFGEEGFWEVMERWKETGAQKDRSMPIYASSTVDAFGMNRVMKDTAMLNQFSIAQNLLDSFRTGKLPASKVFDMEQMAKHFALMDVFQAYHGLIWHNQRYYYNPITSRLEPVAFDGFTTAGPLLWLNRPFMGQFAEMEFISPGQRDMIYSGLFAEPEFMALYVRYLYQYSNENFLRSFLLDAQDELLLRQRLVRKEWPSYHFRPDRLTENAARIHLLLQPTPSVSVKCFTQSRKGDSALLRAHNYHCLPVYLVGVGKAADKLDYSLPEPLFIPAYPGTLPAPTLEFEATAGNKFVFFTVPGLDSTWSAPLFPWQSPSTFTPALDLFASGKPEVSGIAQVRNDTVYFPKGSFQSEKDILIPEGYLVLMEQGFQLDLVRRAKFISKSQILAYGTEEEPIRIGSSDHSAQGFTVIEAPKKSKLRHVIFTHLNTLDYKGWRLTGAVNFYETEVGLDNCAFLHNHCEDALNIIRSTFVLHECEVGFTAFDGFDSDFCKGKVEYSLFHDLGNDGMDFSGSEVEVFHCTVVHPTDKGVSVGEESTAEITDLSVTGGNIGLASKDLSQVVIHSIALDSVKVGFAAYRKKPEYGSAFIDVRAYQVGTVDQLFSIEPGSELLLPKDPKRGTR